MQCARTEEEPCNTRAWSTLAEVTVMASKETNKEFF